MSHYDDNEEYFKEHGGGFFFSIPEGNIWKRAPKLMQEQSEESITKVLVSNITNSSHLDIIYGIASLYIDEEEDSTMFQFHAIRFPDGRQWDVVNGFRE